MQGSVKRVNKYFMEQDLSPKKRIFSEEGMENIVGFCEVLCRIHSRLVMEGYVIKDGKITPPPGVKEVVKRKRAKSN